MLLRSSERRDLFGHTRETRNVHHQLPPGAAGKLGVLRTNMLVRYTSVVTQILERSFTLRYRDGYQSVQKRGELGLRAGNLVVVVVGGGPRAE